MNALAAFLFAPAQALAADGTLEGVGFIRSFFLGQGQYSGLDILDLIALVLLAAVLVQVLRRGRLRRDETIRPDQPVRPGRSDPPIPPEQPVTPADEDQNLEARHARARAAWARLSGEGQSGTPSGSAPGRPAPYVSGPDAPASGFDEKEFLAGAKAVFARIQSAVGRDSYQDLDAFVAGDAREVLRPEVARGPVAGEPEIVLLEAEFLDRRVEGDTDRVRVGYKALMRRRPDQGEPTEYHCVWRFARRAADPTSHWKLEAVEE